jgi:hypothetical protein
VGSFLVLVAVVLTIIFKFFYECKKDDGKRKCKRRHNKCFKIFGKKNAVAVTGPVIH